MFYSDLHTHLLFGTDDGPRDEGTMYALLDEAYRLGTREICLTPHFHPLSLGDNSAVAERAFALLSDYAAAKYPDLTLHFGNELRFYSDCIGDVAAGKCRLLGGRYLLTDFLPSVDLYTVRYAVDALLSSGFRIILAHVERYPVLYGEYELLASLCRRGVLMQVNAATLAAPASLRERWHVARLFSRASVHFVASDTHDLAERSCLLPRAQKYLTSKFGEAAARLLLWENPHKLLSGEDL